MAEQRIKLVSCNFYGIWSYKLKNDSCPICRNELIAACVNCDESLKCKVSNSQCGHGSHAHCIDKWLESSNSCPLCNQEWKLVHKNDSGIRRFFK